MTSKPVLLALHRTSAVHQASPAAEQVDPTRPTEGQGLSVTLCSVDTLSISSEDHRDPPGSDPSTHSDPAPPPESRPLPQRPRPRWGWLRRFGLPKRKQEQKLTGGAALFGQQLSEVTRPTAPPSEVAQVGPATGQGSRPARPTEAGQLQEDRAAALREARTPWLDSQCDGVQAGPSVDGALVRGPLSQSGGLLTRQTAPPRLTEQQLGFLGLPNLAQSCYLNSTLQSLLTLRVFSQEMEQTQWAWSLAPSAQLLREFVAIGTSRCSDNNGHKMAVLSSFKKRVSLQAPEFQDGGQKDAHEFLTAVLDQLRGLSLLLKPAALDMVGRTYSCPVEAHLLFNMLRTRTCKGCEGQSSSMEVFTNLSLDLEPGGSVSQALDGYLTESSLKYACQCGGNTSGTQTCFLTLPNVLVLHLKRFRFTLTGRIEKVEDEVLLSRNLGLSIGTEAGSEDSNTMEKYTLVSVLSHIGARATSGHYISEGAYPEEGNNLADQWLRYNDLKVSRTTGRAVCRQRQRTAYLLFYQRQV
ncbi:unnamed protein product [Arctogadus glacialis]